MKTARDGLRRSGGTAVLAMCLAAVAGAPAEAQSKVDIIEVIKAAILSYTNNGKHTLRVGIENRVVVFSPARGPSAAVAQRANHEFGAPRAVNAQQEVVQIAGVKGSASIEGPRQCRLVSTSRKTGELCGFRDYDAIIGVAAPVFDGTKATLVLVGWNNPITPGLEIHPEYMRYTLAKTGTKWQIIQQIRLGGAR